MGLRSDGLKGVGAGRRSRGSEGEGAGGMWLEGGLGSCEGVEKVAEGET